MTSPETPEPKPRYNDTQLLGVLNDCKTIEELTEVGWLLTEIAEAGDLHISQKVICFCRVKQQEIIYGNRINKDKNQS